MTPQFTQVLSTSPSPAPFSHSLNPTCSTPVLCPEVGHSWHLPHHPLHPTSDWLVPEPPLSPPPHHVWKDSFKTPAGHILPWLKEAAGTKRPNPLPSRWACGAPSGRSAASPGPSSQGAQSHGFLLPLQVCRCGPRPSALTGLSAWKGLPSSLPGVPQIHAGDWAEASRPRPMKAPPHPPPVPVGLCQRNPRPFPLWCLSPWDI